MEGHQLVLWSLEELHAICGGEVSVLPGSVSGISIDTRTLEKGDLFVALLGENGDGHDFVLQALEKGAGAVLVSRQVPGLEKYPHLLVEDTLQALEKIGVRSRARSAARRVGVTGSVGKTGTKDMLGVLLRAYGKTHTSIASYNNHWGVPLTLARMPEETQFGVFEVGMNHPGELTPLSQMIAPQVAVITQIAESHIGHFDSLDGIAEAKAEILEGLQKNGTAVLNGDSPYFEFLKNRAESLGIQHVLSFGENPDANVRLMDVELLPTQSHVTAEVGGKSFSYTLPVPGKHWVMNSLAALGVLKALGLDLNHALPAFQNIRPPKGRGGFYVLQIQGKEKDTSVTLIDESYNANPTSMRAAFEVLAGAPGGRKIAVIGDMREMGDLADRRHRELKEDLVRLGIDQVYCCGPHMKVLYDALPEAQRALWTPLSTELIAPLLNQLQTGDVVMVKGSLGTRMAPIVAALLEQTKKQAS